MVKKILVLFSGVLYVALACNKFIPESETETVSDLRENEKYIQVVSEQHAQPAITKTTLSGDDKVLWQAGDRLSMLYEGGNDELRLVRGEGSTLGWFDGCNDVNPGLHYVLYPYNSTASYAEGHILFTLPEIQTYSADSFGPGDNPAVARLEGETAYTMMNICGSLCLNLCGSGIVRRITLTDTAGNKLWGAASLSTNEDMGTANQDLTITGGSNTLTLECEDGVELSESPVSFYFIVPPGSLASGFSVTVFFLCPSADVLTEAGLTVEDFSASIATGKNNVIKRSIIRTMPARSVESNVLVAHLENVPVRRYMEEITIDEYPNGSSTSRVAEYAATASADNRLDYPLPANITWSANPAATNLTLFVSEHSDFSGSWTFDLADNASSYSVYNLIPGKGWYWKVVGKVESVETIIASGRLFTMGQLRMLYFPGVYNIRDNGGWPTTLGDGSHIVRYGYAYRGASLNNLTAAGKAAWRQVGIGLELDLLNDDQAGYRTTSLVGEDIAYERVPTRQATYDKAVISLDSNIKAMEKAIISVLDYDRPFYYHCAGGADRTGAFGYLLEGLLGVPELYYTKDYELTTFYYGLPRPRSMIRNALSYIAKINGNNTLEQEDFFRYFFEGIPGVNGDHMNNDEPPTPSATIPAARLKAFICFMTGCSLSDLNHLPDDPTP